MMARSTRPDPFGSLYRTGKIKAVFGANFVGPESLKHGSETLVASIKRASEDGQDVEVYCEAMPSMFFTVKAMPAKNFDGNPKQGFTLGTDSRALGWAAETANMIANGMLQMAAIQEEEPEETDALEP